jgi:deleted-in-malignant-brain-tumors protein 1
LGNHSAGQVEIQYQGIWGVVCNINWGLPDAHAICRMLGYKAAEGYIWNIEGETTRRRLMNYVQCSGQEKTIAECYHYGWWNTYCSNDRLAGVICQE